MRIFQTPVVLALSIMSLFKPTPGMAQDFPTRPIRWIVPFLAGTGPDSTVRTVAEAMSGILKQPIVVDNKGGASGNLGAQLAARAAPDGYTWVYSATSMSASMRMYKKPGFDVMQDFTHVGRIALSDLTIVVNPSSGLKTLKELMDRAAKQPGKVTFGSGGVGSPAHLSAELIRSAAKVDMLHIPYKGASESALAVIGKQVDFALMITSVAIPHIQAGRLMPLAVTGPQRNPRLAQTPTLPEAGLPGLQVTSFGGLSVPAGTPMPIVKRISEALNAALEMPDVVTKLEALGGIAIPSKSPNEYRDNLRDEIGRTEQMMKAANLEAQ